MKLSLVFVGLVACTGCPPQSPPKDQAVYDSLVEAGCLVASPDGETAVAQQHVRTDQPTWLVCLYDGGTVEGCGVPCK